jgi:TRAP-type C4-dicarboxylate transport system permease large subunit
MNAPVETIAARPSRLRDWRVWFGVFVVLMCEISLISPPVGMTLYVIHAVRGEGSINDVFQGTYPFFCAMILLSIFIIYFPELVLWLPRVFFG